MEIFVLAVVTLDIVFRMLPRLVDAADKVGETDRSETADDNVAPADAARNVAGSITDTFCFFETTVRVFDAAFFEKRDVPFTAPISFGCKHTRTTNINDLFILQKYTTITTKKQ